MLKLAMEQINIEFDRALDYLQRSLGGARLIARRWQGTEQLPRYLEQGYQFALVKLEGLEVLMMGSKNTEPKLPEFLKQRDLIQRQSGLPVVWVSENIQAYARKQMVLKRVSFVIPFKQMYLPPLGIDFQERIKAAFVKPNDLEKLQVATQVFLINALNKTLAQEMNPKDLAVQMGYSLMTMTRIKDELMAHGWLDIDLYQKTRKWKLNLQGEQLWQEVKSFLASPVRKRIYIQNTFKDLGQIPLAGLSALSQKTLIANPANPVYAMGDQDWRKIEIFIPKDQIFPEMIEGSIELEIWKYSPKKIKLDAWVDPYSLYLSVEHIDDERVQIALNELIESEINSGASGVRSV